MRGYFALVLHAHLPYVRHPEHERSLEERWLYEALWESYLPLLDVLDRLAEDGIRPAITLSISPTLAAMLGDDLLKRRFEDHLARLDLLAAREAARPSTDAGMAGVLGFYRERFAQAKARWDVARGDVLGAFAEHARAGRIELWTTSATHAYLPGLLARKASVRAQLRLGLAAFERAAGVRPSGLWLPECAFDARFLPELAAAGVRVSVLDAHAFDLASPRPPFGVAAPVLAPNGIAFFARDPRAAEDVWSRRTGYPGDAVYREFYRDLGFDLPAEALGSELGPGGTRLMTGLKPYRITGPGPEKALYDPRVALERARHHARDFVARRRASLEVLASRVAAPILVAPFDAELFGHWWFEGPHFIEALVRELHGAKDGAIEGTTLTGYLERFPDAAVVEPSASSWGEGGFGEVWAGPEAAGSWRHIHHAEREVLASLSANRFVQGDRGLALDQALRELLLLESSDFPFMLRRGEMTEYALSRLRGHATAAVRLARMAFRDALSEGERGFLHGLRDGHRFLLGIEGEALRGAFAS